MKYTIFEGDHYSFPFIFKPRFNINRLDFKFILSKQCWYEYENADSNDLNKIYGISYGLTGIHKNSIRLGWIPDFSNKNKIKLYYYGYENNSTHISKYLLTVDTEKEYDIDMFLHGKIGEPIKLCIELNDNIILYDEVCKIKTNWLAFICKPYFGGNNVSPKTMVIEINN